MLVLTMILIGLAFLVWFLVTRRRHKESLEALDRVVNELRSLRLDSRARVSTAKVRNTPQTEEDKLIRLGRASRAKRVVVGGDPESMQYTSVGGKQPEPDQAGVEGES